MIDVFFYSFGKTYQMKGAIYIFRNVCGFQRLDIEIYYLYFSSSKRISPCYKVHTRYKYI